MDREPLSERIRNRLIEEIDVLEQRIWDLEDRIEENVGTLDPSFFGDVEKRLWNRAEELREEIHELESTLKKL